MPLNADKLLALKIPAVEHSYGPKDCMLYALGLGLGQDPLNADELAFVYEKNLKVLPTFALMQGYAAYWLRQPELGVTWAKVVHGEQGLVLYQPVAPQGTVIGRTRILDVVDKGEAKGALIYSQREITDKTSGAACAAAARAGFDLRPADPAGNGADLPAVRRRERAACRSGIRQGRRLPASGFAWPREFRGRRPCAAQDGLRL